ncbi:MAG: guanylate kinase [Ignavibacteriales bacterium]|nr:guanylate kinase [Ignavibacteriales bacterium]
MSRGKLIVLSAPSGSGKTTIAKAIMQKYPEMLFSVSATTRPMRNEEKEGKDYFFLSREQFEKKLSTQDLVEWEKYPDETHGNYYGTLKSEVERALTGGRVMLFDVDVKGALSIKRKYPQDAVLIFIKPPSFEALKERLINRKTEDPATMRRRLERAEMEMEKGREFDFQVVNDELERAIAEIDAIIKEHTHSTTLQH